MSRPVLKISNLRIQRSDTVILDDISWQVNRGEHWVILGANGSGKTSLLSVLMGYLAPTAGEIEVLGEKYGQTDWRTLRTNIGIVSSSVRQMMAESEPALHSVASGKYAMIDFWGTPKRGDLLQARKILKQIECDYLAERPWYFLSQGERQRVLIGRALMSRPSLLILDEPCAGLDPVAREQFLYFLQQFGKRKGSPALVLVTHHVEEIRPVFSHVLLLQSGKVFAAGKKRAVLTSRNVSAAFNAPLKLKSNKGGFSLSVLPKRNVVV